VWAEAIPAYQQQRQPLAQRLGDPSATAQAILSVVDAAQPPLRIALGPRITLIRQRYAERLETWRKGEDVGLAAQGQ
jgi:hypothetical protein